ncbi:MBL fold metallo-hydrolase [Actinoplanes rectilineatus]|uniref:MBL fold metallo-hydrolase n=1 Tax=Actinoplanes rectilineatus TaxID=113571 RepID=UPI0005F2B4F0|nr:MBL fold metallo-hydrolase [Actinoplanes rectilineatus]
MGVSDEAVHLRSTARVEPLVDRFPARVHLVSPVPAATALAGRHVPMLESYLRGEPVAGLAAGRTTDVAALLDGIRRDRADVLGFAAAVAEAEDLLERAGPGSDPRTLHPRLPSDLHGLAEVVHDARHRAGLRFLEASAYTSRFYDESRQSVRLAPDDAAARAAGPGTPRLPHPGVLDLAVPFRHPGWDELFTARIRPTTVARLREALGLDDEQTARLRPLLTAEPAAAPDRHLGTGGRVRWFGHACLVFQTPESAVVTDPVIGAGDRYTLDDLPDRIDLVLLTQDHPEHLVLETLLQLRSRIGAVVVPRSPRGDRHEPSIALCLRALGLPVIEVDDFDETAFPGGTVVATPFLDEQGRSRAGSTYLIRMAGARFFAGSDTSGADPVVYRYVRRHLGEVDLAFFGMDRLSAREASALVTELGADEAYLYATGAHQRVDAFLGWCHDRGITAEHLVKRREWCW